MRNSQQYYKINDQTHMVTPPEASQRKYSHQKNSDYLTVPRAPSNNLSFRKDSLVTNSTINPETEKDSSPHQQKIIRNFIHMTPTENRFFQTTSHPLIEERSFDVYDRFSSRLSNKFTPQSNKVSGYQNQRSDIKQMNTDIRHNYRNQGNGRNIETYSDQIQRLKKQNLELKQRLSVRQTCSCKAPYIQEEVQYLREKFCLHIEKHHAQFFKS